jgi:hypothetical protein
MVLIVVDNALLENSVRCREQYWCHHHHHHVTQSSHSINTIGPVPLWSGRNSTGVCDACWIQTVCDTTTGLASPPILAPTFCC